MTSHFGKIHLTPRGEVAVCFVDIGENVAPVADRVRLTLCSIHRSQGASISHHYLLRLSRISTGAVLHSYRLENESAIAQWLQNSPVLIFKQIFDNQKQALAWLEGRPEYVTIIKHVLGASANSGKDGATPWL